MGNTNLHARSSRAGLRGSVAGALVVAALAWQIAAVSGRALATWRGEGASPAVRPSPPRRAQAAASLLREHCAPGDTVLAFPPLDLEAARLVERLRHLAYPVRLVDGWSEAPRPGDARALWALVFPGAFAAERTSDLAAPVATWEGASLHRLREASPPR